MGKVLGRSAVLQRPLPAATAYPTQRQSGVSHTFGSGNDTMLPGWQFSEKSMKPRKIKTALNIRAVYEDSS
jgi:hypothetical protein